MDKDIELTYIQIDITNLPEHQERTYKITPTKKARELSKEVASYILNSRNILPNKVAPLTDGGLRLVYDNNSMKVNVEVYNDLFMSATLVDSIHEIILDSLEIHTTSDVQLVLNLLLDKEY